MLELDVVTVEAPAKTSSTPEIKSGDTTYIGEEVAYAYFSARVGVRELSNFSKCANGIKMGGTPLSTRTGKPLVFPTSEHAFQAMSKCHESEWERFADCGTNADGVTVVGELADPAAAWLRLTNASSDGATKMAYWGNHGAGIVAKMAVKPDVAHRFGIRMKPRPDDEAGYVDEIEPLFKEILLAKYRQNPKHRAALLRTGDRLLVEFDSMAYHKVSNTHKGYKVPLWAGQIQYKVLYGRNTMGRWLMDVRAQIRDEFATESVVE